MRNKLSTRCLKTILTIAFIMSHSVAYAKDDDSEENKRIPWLKTTRNVYKAPEIKLENKAEKQVVVTQKKLNQEAKACYQQDKELYDQAFEKLMKGEYQSSIDAYRFFIANYPNSKHIGDAHYWMAEAIYLSENYRTAIDKYKFVIENYSENKNVKYAELKIGHAYIHIKKWPEAKKAFNDAINNHPNSTIKKLAQTELNLMKEKGYN